MNNKLLPASLWQEATENESMEKKSVYKEFVDMGVESVGLMTFSPRALLTVRNVMRLVYHVFPESIGSVKCIRLTHCKGGNCSRSGEIHLSNKQNWNDISSQTSDIILLRNVFSHEMGHAVAFHKNIDCWRLKRYVLRELGLYPADVPANLSQYACKNTKEFVAEAFMEYMTSIKPRPIALLVGKMFRKRP